MEDAALCETGEAVPASLGAATETATEIDLSEQAQQQRHPSSAILAATRTQRPVQRCVPNATLPPAQEAEPGRTQRAVESKQALPSPAPSDAAGSGASRSSEKRKRDEGAKLTQTKRARWAQKSGLGLSCAVAAPRVASPGGTEPRGRSCASHPPLASAYLRVCLLCLAHQE